MGRGQGAVSEVGAEEPSALKAGEGPGERAGHVCRSGGAGAGGGGDFDGAGWVFFAD